jgi:hypothetical protein
VGKCGKEYYSGADDVFAGWVTGEGYPVG